MNSNITYMDAYDSYERDLKETQGSGILANKNGIWSFSVVSVRTPPGRVTVRQYKVDTLNFAIHVEVQAGEPGSFSEKYTLDCMKNEVLQYQRSEATKAALQLH